MNKQEFKIQHSIFREAYRELRNTVKHGSKKWDDEFGKLLDQFPAAVRSAALSRKFIVLRKVASYTDRIHYKLNSREFPGQHIRGQKLTFENQEIFNRQFYRSRGINC